jgi:hypothetical protein
MAVAQAFGNICQSKVSADTTLSDDALRRALDLDEDISVMHVLVDQDDSSADHIWRLSSQEQENVRDYQSSGLQGANWIVSGNSIWPSQMYPFFFGNSCNLFLSVGVLLAACLITMVALSDLPALALSPVPERLLFAT